MGNHKIIQLYNQKLKHLGIPFKEKRIKTSFGNTNTIIFGNAKKPPLFLIHGLNSAVPFALDTVSFLLNRYQIFGIDVLGQPNKSDFIRLDKKNDSYGEWLMEIITHFKVDNITLLGISFGAFPILKLLLIDDKKVKEIFLISPAALIHGSLWKTIFGFLIPLNMFKKTRKTTYLKKCLLTIYDDYDDFKFNYFKEVFTHFKMDFSPTPNFKKSELKNIKIPISIIASKDDFFVPAKKLNKRCKKHIFSLKSFTILEHSKHIPSKKILTLCLKKITIHNDD